MAYSLLAYLYPYIKGSQEDIATFSLQYLLAQSVHLNRAFTKYMAHEMKLGFEDVLQYVCQVTGNSDEKERPDMAGLDINGKEVVLFEMKFYASLTVNQPVTYLERLKKNDVKGLMFVCPTARRTNLWNKLKSLCAGMNVVEVSEYCVEVDGVKLSITTWSEIINILKQVAAAVDISFTADIAQLEGYCNQMDSDAFMPFSAEDLSAERAKMEERYYAVTDELFELLMADKSHKTSKKGTKASAYRNGYTRSLAIDGYTITFNYDRKLWKNPASVETPFWVAIRDENWKQTDEICDKLKCLPDQKKEHFWDSIFLCVEPMQNVTLAEVCEDMKRQIEGYLNLVDDFSGE